MSIVCQPQFSHGIDRIDHQGPMNQMPFISGIRLVDTMPGLQLRFRMLQRYEPVKLKQEKLNLVGPVMAGHLFLIEIRSEKSIPGFIIMRLNAEGKLEIGNENRIWNLNYSGHTVCHLNYASDTALPVARLQLTGNLIDMQLVIGGAA